ncbi:hemerythrin domain-containing protein [Ochrobactrum oryzae]|uniref:Calcium-binding protein n=1 Tax=Brucella oryzae TaxID=335286 RepID=A0A2S7J0Y8_9HYPH|nr:hemerythrin domain-containing protein [Brucella oryzae]NKC23181.1 hemerythrin domain-containing protein [Brucella oryzae]PQA73921.1 calcium-binding protein [Brucella oryzae]
MDTLPALHATDISRLEAHHHELLQLCLQLEEIAGDLESDASMQEYWRIAKLIPRLVSETHALEEEVLFPDFSRQAHSHFANAIIERLKAEHRCDRMAAEELSQTLTAVAKGCSNLAADTISYMMRGFMESVRRHILSEKLMIEALLAAKSEQREVFG